MALRPSLSAGALAVCLACGGGASAGGVDAAPETAAAGDSGQDAAAVDVHAGDGSIFCADPCDDGKPCTDDVCYVKIGCTHIPHSGTCDDGNPCTSDDFCVDDTCAGQKLSCDDGNACTDDACVLPGGCTHTTHC